MGRPIDPNSKRQRVMRAMQVVRTADADALVEHIPSMSRYDIHFTLNDLARDGHLEITSPSKPLGKGKGRSAAVFSYIDKDEVARVKKAAPVKRIANSVFDLGNL